MDVDVKISSIMSNQGQRCGLEDIPLILSRVNFNKKFQIITVAGTNGKGTTVAMLEELLTANNKNVISHTSPHVYEFKERICINKKPISNNLLLELLERLQELTEDYSLGYYQIAFLCCCLLSQRIPVDYLILEVGLGGRLDAANALDPDITAITNISLDHCEILGDTVEKIGIEKAAICREKIPLFLGSSVPNSVIEYAKAAQAKIFDLRYESNQVDCFTDSYNIAMGIAQYLFSKMKISYIPRFAHIRANARYLFLKQDLKNNSYVVVDVAHNEASVRHLFKLLIEKFKDSDREIKFEAIFGILRTKDIKTILEIAKQYVYRWDVIDLQKVDDRALDINKIKEEFERQNIVWVDYHKDLSSVYMSKKDTVTVVFGSFVMAGEFLKEYEKNSSK
ncbi:bifunctional folylpolyglutamate synthase/dihydrofolate synthase [Pseudofrancisella aestuarii]|uniref:Bifunctional folylpolyglutamate synthase/dihydrofolate synthase n=1 Tax=Pseudofrancisella aestuarii TaxID=2670347 RepID=A0ABV9TC80_9GAMM|nr:Mur ligase family protein [Pseudofrancisella aestuarii]